MARQTRTKQKIAAIKTNGTVLLFTGDWQQTVQGALLPGLPFSVRYDGSRLPNERSTYNGMPTWEIIAYAQFSPGKPATQVILNPCGDGNYLEGAFEMPDDATEVQMWFLNTGRSGLKYWDSNYGSNYRFCVGNSAIHGVFANLVSSWPTPYSGLFASLKAEAEVERVYISFPIIDASGNANWHDVALGKASEVNADGTYSWKIDEYLLPYRASVNFQVIYRIGCDVFFDSNNAMGYSAQQSG
jgi:hypothetical protein